MDSVLTYNPHSRALLKICENKAFSRLARTGAALRQSRSVAQLAAEDVAASREAVTWVPRRRHAKEAR
jgi:hypothetical protein